MQTSPEVVQTTEPQSTNTFFSSEIALRWLPPLVFFGLLIVSWRRWTSLIVDTGREMDLPARLLRGEMLYRDIHYLYPPLSPYFNSWLMKIFGLHLEVLNFEGTICSGLIVWLCYRISRRILSEAESALAASAVVVWCIFKPEGNLISPYAFSALHGMTLALATLLITLRYGEAKKWGEVVRAGILIGLAGITKQEFALTAAVTWSAGMVFIHRREVKNLLIKLLVPAAISLAIATPVYAYFLSSAGWKTLIDDCHLLYTGIPSSLVFYNTARTGLDHPLSSILQMIGGSAVASALCCLVIFFSLLKIENRKILQTIGAGFGASILVAVIIGIISRGRWDGSPLRALPFALIGLILINFFQRDQTRPRFALFVIAVYSLMALIRVVLRVPSGGAFGGYFLPTSLILIVYLTAIALPKYVERFIRQYSTKSFPATLKNELIGTHLKLIGLGLLSMWLLATIGLFAYRYRKTFPVLIEAPHGSLYVTRETAQATIETLDFIGRNISSEDSIAILPEGSSLAFLSGRRMPLRHQIFIPDFMDAEEEQRAIDRMADVKYVMIVNRPMREFGKEAFGRDYYQKMGDFIERKYRLVKTCGEVKDENLTIGSPHFFIKIFQQK